MTSCFVVIPYYQKQPGILVRALKSVFAQTFRDFEIIIVDDASPLPIEGELAALSDNERALIHVVKQENQGPGGARNTGLNAVPEGAEFVAFLDSDDDWTPDHLTNAVTSMRRFDADCYWASIKGGDEFYYHFGVSTVEERAASTRLQEDPLIIEVDDLAGVMLENWSFMHMSAMVIGEALFRKVRFEASLRLAAEDVLFFYDCVKGAKRTLLCDAAGAVRGEGVNIFHSIDNESPLFLQQQFNTWVALDNLEGRGQHRPEHMASIHGYKQTARRQALWSQVGLLRKSKIPQFGLLAQWAWRDPRLIRSAMELAIGKFSKQA